MNEYLEINTLYNNKNVATKPNICNIICGIYAVYGLHISGVNMNEYKGSDQYLLYITMNENCTVIFLCYMDGERIRVPEEGFSGIIMMPSVYLQFRL